MRKKHHRLWPEITAFDNLLRAFRKAAKGKRSKPAVASFEYDLEANLLTLQAELRSNSYKPGPYANFTIHETKRRLISAAPFRDRVVHHALVNIIEPIYERKFIYDTYANRKGKGTHKALDRCTYFLRRYPYVLPLDVRQFFPSIDHAILLKTLSQAITDEQVLNLCAVILEGGAGIQEAEYDMVYFPDDDLFAVNRPRGLPIGNLTSQFWANVYLNGFDHFVKRRLGCKAYIRYVDDMLLFANEKSTLHKWWSEAIAYMASLRLTIHESRAQPCPTRTGVPFLGFQVFPDHRRLKRRNVVHARRRLKRLASAYREGEVDLGRVDASVQGWINHARYGDTWGLRKAIMTEIVL